MPPATLARPLIASETLKISAGAGGIVWENTIVLPGLISRAKRMLRGKKRKAA